MIKLFGKLPRTVYLACSLMIVLFGCSDETNKITLIGCDSGKMYYGRIVGRTKITIHTIFISAETEMLTIILENNKKIDLVVSGDCYSLYNMSGYKVMDKY